MKVPQSVLDFKDSKESIKIPQSIVYSAEGFRFILEITSRISEKLKEIDRLKSENADLENSARIVQAELKRQYERVDALMGENKLLSERVKELEANLIKSREINRIYCDQLSKEKADALSELKTLRKSYLELKADHETVHVTVRCEKCK